MREKWLVALTILPGYKERPIRISPAIFVACIDTECVLGERQKICLCVRGCCSFRWKETEKGRSPYYNETGRQYMF